MKSTILARRGKKKKKPKNAKWRREFAEAKRMHEQQKKERAQMFKDFERLIE